jgi:hypothetical protein
MPYDRFRKSQKSRFGFQTSRRSSNERFSKHSIRPADPIEVDSEVRMDVVRLAQEKLAMGIYDNPAVLERALDRFCADLDR